MALLVTGDLRPQEWNHIEAWSGGYGPHKLLKYGVLIFYLQIYLKFSNNVWLAPLTS